MSARRASIDRLSARARGYGAAWDRARISFLRLHPYCAECAREGLIVAATVVDHVVPHRGDQRLFWDQANWQSLCTSHHSSDKQMREKRGYSSRLRSDGLPSDPSHPFYEAQGDLPSADDRRQRASQGGRRASGQREGTSKVEDRRGAGPIGDHRAELVSGFGPEGFFEGETARLGSARSDRASGSAGETAPPSIASSPSLMPADERHGP